MTRLHDKSTQFPYELGLHDVRVPVSTQGINRRSDGRVRHDTTETIRFPETELMP
jgi:hypothetical protein